MTEPSASPDPVPGSSAPGPHPDAPPTAPGASPAAPGPHSPGPYSAAPGPHSPDPHSPGPYSAAPGPHSPGPYSAAPGHSPAATSPSPAAPGSSPAGTSPSPAGISPSPAGIGVLDALEPWPDTVEWRPVSRSLITVELINRAIWVLIVLAGLAVGWVLNDFWLWPTAMAAVLVLAIWRSIVTVRAVKAWGYAERDNDLLVRHGLVIRRLSIVPYARMQFVDVTAGPLERAFNLATVQLHTAAAASDARIPGLLPEEAARLRDRLTALGEDRAEGL